MKEIQLQTEYITLGQLLKIAGVIQTGGQAKCFLQEHATAITVNGVTENRRGKKLYPADVVVIADVGEFKLVAA
ncbi:S4 domain-containing protein YaaA [Ligilactobacillus saerimneri]